VELHLAFAVVGAVCLAAGVLIGFVVGIDAAAQIFARRWLELHPDDGPLPVVPRWWR
jgi:hypothetical protein